MVISLMLLGLLVLILLVSVAVLIDLDRNGRVIKKRKVLIFFVTLGLAVVWQSYHLIDNYGIQ